MIYHCLLTHCFRKTPERVVLQTVKTQMKCSIISSVSTLFVKVKKRSSGKKIQYLLKIII